MPSSAEVATLAHARYELEGLDCPSCGARLEKGVAALPGMQVVKLNFAARLLELDFDPAQISPPEIRRRVSLFGVSIVGIQASGDGGLIRGFLGALLADMHGLATLASVVLAIAATVASMLGAPAAVVMALAILAVAGVGVRVGRAALASVMHARRADMNVLMFVAAVGALAVGQPLEGAIAMALYGIGRFLEDSSGRRSRRALATLLELTPTDATVLGDDGKERSMPVGEVPVGARILVAPSARIPLDGEILEGGGAFDESSLTGESLPAHKVPGDLALGGTINGERRLIIRVQKPMQENVVARIIARMEAAVGSRASSERWIDSFAAIYTPLVMLLALLVAVIPPLFLGAAWLASISVGLVVLVTACPCALVISTPVAIAAAIGAGSRHGVLFKGGDAIESLADARAIAFDKTGTLTRGVIAITQIECASGVARARVLALAAALEANSSHPIARAINDLAVLEGVRAEAIEDGTFENMSGRGIAARIAGERFVLGSPMMVAGRADDAALLLASEGGVLARFWISDKVRPEARAVVARLRAGGLAEVAMLSGDRREIAESIAAEAGITRVGAPLLPDEKLAAIADLRASFGAVVMVGDGINDVPALAAADAGIVMVATSTSFPEAAADVGSVALLGNSLSRIPYAFTLGRAARRVIKQNVVVSLLIKLAFLPLAVAGMVPLWLAVAADMGTSLAVTANSIRLFRVAPAPFSAGELGEADAHDHDHDHDAAVDADR